MGEAFDEAVRGGEPADTIIDAVNAHGARGVPHRLAGEEDPRWLDRS